jgi:hypothetical protein
MNAFGGFLGLESGSANGGAYHPGPAFSTGRACLRAIMDAVRPARVHLPFYVCDAVLEPLRRAGIPHVFYAIDRDLAPSDPPREVPGDELYLVVNYFGLLGHVTGRLAERWRGRVVADNVQGFFHRDTTECWSFNSARKFFGVPDGAYLRGPAGMSLPTWLPAEPTTDHLTLGSSGDQVAAYRAFRRHELAIGREDRMISAVSEDLLRRLDYAEVANRRHRNFLTLHEELGELNGLRVVLREGEVPSYYPFLAPSSLHDGLMRRGVFVPRLWADVVARPVGGFDWERDLAERMCPLPIDQRYDGKQMRQIAARVVEALRE